MHSVFSVLQRYYFTQNNLFSLKYISLTINKHRYSEFRFPLMWKYICIPVQHFHKLHYSNYLYVDWHFNTLYMHFLCSCKKLSYISKFCYISLLIYHLYDEKKMIPNAYSFKYYFIQIFLFQFLNLPRSKDSKYFMFLGLIVRDNIIVKLIFLLMVNNSLCK